MTRKKPSEIFAKVDPNLRVIDAHRHKKSHWDASGGAICPKCGMEAVRFRPEDGVCRQCANLLNDKFFRDEAKHAKFLRFIKAHNARIDRKKKRDAN